METEILHEIQTIRAYLFICTIIFVFWVSIKILQSLITIFNGFKKAQDERFIDSMEKLMNKGKYKQVIGECLEELEENQNNINANWYLARAYYCKEENELSKKYFAKTVHLVPSWKESAMPYLEELDKRLNSN